MLTACDHAFLTRIWVCVCRCAGWAGGLGRRDGVKGWVQSQRGIGQASPRHKQIGLALQCLAHGGERRVLTT